MTEDSNELMTEYEKGLRKLYFIDNVKRGLQNMEELNDALCRPLDNVSLSSIGIIYHVSRIVYHIASAYSYLS
jgi:hypothetical protein